MCSSLINIDRCCLLLLQINYVEIININWPLGIFLWFWINLSNTWYKIWASPSNTFWAVHFLLCIQSPILHCYGEGSGRGESVLPLRSVPALSDVKGLWTSFRNDIHICPFFDLNCFWFNRCRELPRCNIIWGDTKPSGRRRVLARTGKRRSHCLACLPKCWKKWTWSSRWKVISMNRDKSKWHFTPLKSAASIQQL